MKPLLVKKLAGENIPRVPADISIPFHDIQQAEGLVKFLKGDKPLEARITHKVSTSGGIFYIANLEGFSYLLMNRGDTYIAIGENPVVKRDFPYWYIQAKAIF